MFMILLEHDADGYPKSFINVKNYKFELFDST